jgi:flagellar hook-length control protein FliK
LQSPVGTSAWVEELGAQLSWMVNRGIESASLHVSPVELGPIEVRIALHGSDASVWFGAAQTSTRTALEQALPQLRQLFASQGLALADAGVFREPPRGSAHQAPARSLAPVAAVSEETSRTADTRAVTQLGLLDLYA